MDYSESGNSDIRRDGLKRISSSVYNILQEHGRCTYKFLCSKVNTNNNNTLRRRIYDVLSVMRALNMVEKDGKEYRLRNERDSVKEKKRILNNLKNIKEGIEYLIRRNREITVEEFEKFRLPFFLICVDKTADVHCETNDDRTFFKFKATSEIKLVEDLEIIKECNKNTGLNVESKKHDNFFNDKLNVFDELQNDPFTFI